MDPFHHPCATMTCTLPSGDVIHACIEAQVQRAPTAIAVEDLEQAITYQELDSRANRLARHLRRLGVGPDTLLGLCARRSLEMVVGILGILKAGGAYVPLDPTYPKARLAALCADSRVRLLLSQQGLASGLPETGAQAVCLDTDWPTIALEQDVHMESVTSPDHLAYVIYTSGSTGKPKGVMVTHGNLLASTCARTTYYRDPIDSFLLLPSFAFDSSVAVIFWTLCQGGRLVLPPPGWEHKPRELTEFTQSKRISHWLSIPSLYDLVLQTDPTALHSLQVVIVAGEPCPPALVERHAAYLPQTALFNEYGPTETTVWASVYRCEHAPGAGVIPIGRPIDNTQIYILDERMKPVPIGVPGEVYIGGAGVARGYLNQPQLTAERFVPDPWSQDARARLYKTGDRACCLPDGNIVFLGRLDDQVKIRGYRIELGEIEAQLLSHPAVRICAVAVHEDRLVAYIVPTRDPCPVAELRTYLGGKLPSYMLPAGYVWLARLPELPNGKVDRHALRLPSWDSSLDGAWALPRTPVEEHLSSIVAGILQLAAVNMLHSFLELGGDSLSALDFSLCLSRDFGVVMSDEIELQWLALPLSHVASQLEAQRDASGNHFHPRSDAKEGV